MRTILRHILVSWWIIPTIAILFPMFDWLFTGKVDWAGTKELIKWFLEGEE